MECSEPGAIRDEELFAYIAGEKVRPAVLQHLASCQYCLSRANTFRRIELQLINTLYRWDCPPSQILGDYQFGLLSPQQAVAMKNHLQACVLCAEEVKALTEFLANDPMLVDRSLVPQQVSAYSGQNNHVQKVKRALESVRDRSLEGVRRIVATLEPPQPRLAYQRGIMSQQTALWPRRYTAEDVSISIQVERTASRHNALQVIGFVTRKGSALEALQGTPVQLLSQTKAMYTQNVDDLGNFMFSSIVPATYTLELQFPETTIVIDQLLVDMQD